MAFSMVGCSKKEKNRKNVILMIGDGMGTTHIQAAQRIKGENLCFQDFPQQVFVETRCYDYVTTDSSAAATAMATGTRINKGYVGIDVDGNELSTIVDFAVKQGKRTGILTTETLYGATPMGFAAHASDRNDSKTLIQSAATSSNVNLFVGYRMRSADTWLFQESGYTQIPDYTQISESQEEKIIGVYDIVSDIETATEDDPVTFDVVVREALEYLSQDKDGFFMMAEGAHIDKASHNTAFKDMISHMLAFDAAVQAVLDWAKDRDDTIVIVTADHETGGLRIGDEPVATWPYFPYIWSSVGSHTSADVSCYVYGAEIDFTQYAFASSERIQNTDIYQIMKELLS